MSLYLDKEIISLAIVMIMERVKLLLFGTGIRTAVSGRVSNS